MAQLHGKAENVRGGYLHLAIRIFDHRLPHDLLRAVLVVALDLPPTQVNTAAALQGSPFPALWSGGGSNINFQT